MPKLEIPRILTTAGLPNVSSNKLSTVWKVSWLAKLDVSCKFPEKALPPMGLWKVSSLANLYIPCNYQKQITIYLPRGDLDGFETSLEDMQPPHKFLRVAVSAQPPQIFATATSLDVAQPLKNLLKVAKLSSKVCILCKASSEVVPSLLR